MDFNSTNGKKLNIEKQEKSDLFIHSFIRKCPIGREREREKKNQFYK